MQLHIKGQKIKIKSYSKCTVVDLQFHHMRKISTTGKFCDNSSKDIQALSCHCVSLIIRLPCALFLQSCPKLAFVSMQCLSAIITRTIDLNKI